VSGSEELDQRARAQLIAPITERIRLGHRVLWVGLDVPQAFGDFFSTSPIEMRAYRLIPIVTNTVVIMFGLRSRWAHTASSVSAAVMALSGTACAMASNVSSWLNLLSAAISRNL
jgi:hypothetical protein